ncbi:MAG: GDSL-type esterase/lipase family protein [Myxococcota bacterium]
MTLIFATLAACTAEPDPPPKGDAPREDSPKETLPPPPSDEPRGFKVLPADDPRWVYMGRIDQRARTAPILVWSGSSVKGVIDATTITVQLQGSGTNWVNVYVDDEEPQVIELLDGIHDYVVAEGLAPGPHAFRLSKRTEAADGALRFRGVMADGWLEESERPAFGIEFYGDSITSSYSIECACDEALPEYKNFDLSYAALAAEAVGAEARAISISGIGIQLSWWPETMFDHWDGLQLGDGAWDFSWQPELVVVNLGQNDYWLGAGSEIQSTYIDFYDALRDVYPDADVLLALGSMDAVAFGSPMPGYLELAVETLQQQGDDKVHSLVFDYNGHGRHPEVADHEVMADALTSKILEIREADPNRR